MSVVFLPNYTSANPYQSNLAAGLDEEVAFGDSDGFLPILSAVRSCDEVSVVHFHWLNPYLVTSSRLRTVGRLALTLLQLVVLRLAGISVVWTVHNVVSHESLHPRVERWAKGAFIRFGFCDAVFVHCEAVREDIAESYGLPASLVRERTRVIPHGHYIDNYANDTSPADARELLGLDSDTLVFLFFGQVRPYKGVLRLIDAFEAVDVDDARLLIVGSPIDQSIERAVRRRSATADRVHTYLEFVPDDEIQRYMNAADCVVLPYDDITTSGSAILAMSFGKPVIAPRTGCVPVHLDDVGSLLYPPGDPQGLPSALVAASTHELAAMGEHNRRAVRAYDWDAIAATTARVYAQVG